MARPTQPNQSNGRGDSVAPTIRASFSDLARTHWRWEVELERAGASVRTEARHRFDAILAEFEKTEVEQANVVSMRLADHLLASAQDIRSGTARRSCCRG